MINFLLIFAGIAHAQDTELLTNYLYGYSLRAPCSPFETMKVSADKITELSFEEINNGGKISFGPNSYIIVGGEKIAIKFGAYCDLSEVKGAKQFFEVIDNGRKAISEMKKEILKLVHERNRKVQVIVAKIEAYQDILKPKLEHIKEVAENRRERFENIFEYLKKEYDKSVSAIELQFSEEKLAQLLYLGESPEKLTAIINRAYEERVTSLDLVVERLKNTITELEESDQAAYKKQYQEIYENLVKKKELIDQITELNQQFASDIDLYIEIFKRIAQARQTARDDIDAQYLAPYQFIDGKTFCDDFDCWKKINGIDHPAKAACDFHFNEPRPTKLTFNKRPLKFNYLSKDDVQVCRCNIRSDDNNFTCYTDLGRTNNHFDICQLIVTPIEELEWSNNATVKNYQDSIRKCAKKFFGIYHALKPLNNGYLTNTNPGFNVQVFRYQLTKETLYKTLEPLETYSNEYYIFRP